MLPKAHGDSLLLRRCLNFNLGGLQCPQVILVYEGNTAWPSQQPGQLCFGMTSLRGGREWDPAFQRQPMWGSVLK